MIDVEEFGALRIPPHSIEAESAVLGAAMLQPGIFDVIAEKLTAEDFYRFENRLVFAAMARLDGANQPIDVVTVCQSLQSEGKADDVGGLAYLNQLAQYVPSGHNVREYAEAVSDASLLRKMAAVGDEVVSQAYAKGLTSAQSRVHDAVVSIMALEGVKGRKEPVHVSETLGAMLQEIEDLADGKREPGIPSPFWAYNRLSSGGFKPGQLICIGARPSVGKSSLALSICAHLAGDGHPVAFLSQEMALDEQTRRLVANVGAVELDALQTGKNDGKPLTNDQWQRITEGTQKASLLPLYIDDQAGLTLGDIQAKARGLVRRHKVKLLVIDYLQLCQVSGKNKTRTEAIGEISRGLKQLAQQLKITVVILSQLNREVEKRTGGKPTMADLRDSGEIEQDCDAIMLLHTQCELPEGALGVACEVAKMRGGRKGLIGLRFAGKWQQWQEHELQQTKRAINL